MQGRFIYNRLVCGLMVLVLGSATPRLGVCQDITAMGGGLTSDLPLTVLLELPAPTVTDKDRFQFHLAGHNNFHQSFVGVKVDGRPILGPRFNHNSCGACHVRDGRGPIRFLSRPPGSAVLVKVSMRGLQKNGAPKDVPGVGEQLQDHQIGGKSLYNLKLEWLKVRGSYPDKTRYVLRKPKLSFTIPGMRSDRVVSSLRMTPTIFGMGLLESIPDESLLAMADPDDADGDGISGKVNMVIDHETGEKAIGRFGLRASHPTVRQQTAAAYFNDMGLTNEIFNPSKKADEISSEVFSRVVFYQQAAGIAPARDQNDPDVIAGKQLFLQVGCDSCHRMTLRTGEGKVPEVSNQEFHPFTDLLLHDMGRGLADKRPEFSANGREWRTTPLWGLGLVGIISSIKPGYLHDGRARTPEEAILWHDGEAKQSRDAFKALDRSARAQLLRFLNSL